MISMFVSDNRMSQWQLSKKAKRNRADQVMQSYKEMDELKEAGELDHIEIPKSPLHEALERVSYNKYDFLGIINEMGTMKSYRPEQLDQMSRKSNIFGPNDMSRTFGDVNPLNYTGNFSYSGHNSQELGQ